VLLVAASASCKLLNTVTGAPAKVFSGGSQKPGADPNTVSLRLMRFADIFVVEIDHAAREFEELAGTVEAREQALSWRLDYATTLYRLVTSQKPFAGLFDTAILITALHSTHENRWLGEWGEADRPMVDSLGRLEEAVWLMAGEVLSKEELDEMRQMVQAWLGGEEARFVDIANMPGLLDLAKGSKSGASGVVDSLTQMVTLDPLSGLEPAVREVEQARLLGERLFFFTQRMPGLLATRIELMTLRSVQTSEARGALESWERLSKAAESMAATAASFPAEREAALTQISTELTAQREGLVHDLETSREPLVELLEETRSATEAGRAMSDSLTQTLQALDAFMGRFDKEEKEGPEVETPPAEKPAGRPFDITEYGDTAERIGVAVGELAEAIATLDRSLPEVQRVLDEVVARGTVGVDHAFRRGLQLLLAGLAGAASAVLAVRWISRRLRISPERDHAA
jgi:hypothetical protein